MGKQRKDEDQFFLTEEELNQVEQKDKNGSVEKQEDLKPKSSDFVMSESELATADMIQSNPFAVDDITSSQGRFDSQTNPDNYGFQLRINEDNDKLRAYNQSATDQFGNFVAQSILDGVIGQSIGSVGSAIELPTAAADYFNNKPADFNNTLIKWANDLKEFGQEEFPIYRKNPTKSFDVGDFAWLMQGLTSVASTVGLLLPGMVAGKVAGKAAKNLSKALRASVKTAEYGEDIAKLASSALVMRNAEGFMESARLVKEMKESLMGKWEGSLSEWEKARSTKTAKDLQKQGVPLTKENLANHIAAKAGWRSYNINMHNILFDAIQIAPLLKLNRLGRIQKSLAKTSKKASKNISNTKRIFNNFGGIVARQSTEGIEEIVNYLGTEEGRYYGNTLAGEKETNINSRAASYLSDGHLWESGFWGVIGGVAFESVGRGINKITDNNERKKGIGVAQQHLADRKVIVKETIDKINALESGKNSFVDSNGYEHDLSNLDTVSRENQIEQAKTYLGYDLAFRSIINGSFDTLKDQVNDNSFLEVLQELGDISGNDIETTKSNLLQNIEKAKKIYDKAYDLAYNSDVKNEDELKVLQNRLIDNYVQQDLQELSKNRFQSKATLDSQNSKAYKKAYEANPLFERYLESQALVQAQLMIEKAIDDSIGNNLLNISKSKEQANKNLKEQLEKIEKELKESEFKKNFSVNNPEIKEIITNKAIAKVNESIEDILIDNAEKLVSKQGTQEVKKQAKAQQKELEDQLFSQVEKSVEALYKINNETPLSKINSNIEEITNNLEGEKDVRIRKLLENKLNDLNYAKRKKTSVAKKEEETVIKEPLAKSDKSIKKAKDIKTKKFDFEESLEEDETNGQLADVNESFEEEEEASVNTIKTSVPTEEGFDETDDKGLNPKTVEKEIPTKNVAKNRELKNITKPTREVIKNEGSTSIALAGIINNLNVSDKENSTVEKETSTYKLLKGEYKEGDTVSLIPSLKGNDPSSIDIIIQDRENNLIGYLNKVSSKKKYLETRKEKLIKEGKLKDSKGNYIEESSKQERDKAVKEIQLINNEIKNLKELRQYLFLNRDSFSSSPFKSKITRISSGSIINLEESQKLKDSFGEDIILYKVNATNNEILEAPNAPKAENHRRLAYEDSYLNNADGVYTPGVFFTLVDTPNNVKFPVPLQSNNLSETSINKIVEGLKYIIDGISNRNQSVNHPDIIFAKDILNQITYIGKNNITIFDTDINLYNTDDKGITTRYKLMFNQKNPDGSVKVNLSKAILSSETNEYKKEGNIVSNEQAFKETKEFLKKFIYNPNKKYVNTTGTYVDPISLNFDKSVNDNPIVHDNYLSYLNDSNILTTNVGRVIDDQNNIVSNFAIKGKSNLIVGIDTSFKTTTKEKSKSQKIQEDGNSITNILFSKFESFNKLKDLLNLNDTFDTLFDYADNKDIKITNRTQLDDGKLAGINIKSRNISFNRNLMSIKESELSQNEFKDLVEEILAHEILHGVILNEVVDIKRLDNDIVNFITSIKNNIDTASPRVKSLINYALTTSPQEVVVLGYTNKEVRDFLSSIPSKTKARGKRVTLLDDLLSIIKKVVSSITGYTKLDELNDIVNNNITENISIEQSQGKSLFEDELDNQGLLGFPANVKGNPTPDNSLTGLELKESVELLSGYFAQIADNPKFKNLTEEEYKDQFLKLLTTLTIKESYGAKENMQKVIANYDKVWNLLLKEINRKQKLSFTRELVDENLDEDFQLEKSWDSNGSALEQNVKDTIPNSVKNSIRKTPIILKINEDASTAKDRYTYDKNNFLQLPKFMDFDLYYPYLQQKLSTIKSSKDLINKLRSLSEYVPSLDYIANQLENDIDLLAGWVSHFEKQSIDYIKEQIISPDNIINSTKIKSSTNNPSEVIARKWTSNLTSLIANKDLNRKELEQSVKVINSYMKDYKNNKKSLISSISNLMNSLNLNYNNLDLENIINNELTNSLNKDIYGSEKSIIDNLFINTLNNIVNVVKNNEFDNRGDLRKLSSIIEKYTVVPLQNTFISSEGKKLYGITLPTFLSKWFNPVRTKDIESLTNLINNHRKVPSMKFSNWLNKMFTLGKGGIMTINNSFFDNFDYNVSDGISERNQIGTSYKNLDSVQWDTINLLKYNRSKSSSFYESAIMIPADSSNIYYINVPKFATTFNGSEISPKSESYQAIKNIVYQEIAAMKQAKDLLFNIEENTGKILGIKDNLDTAILQENYHYKYNSDGTKFFIENGKPTGNVFKFSLIPELNNSSLLHNGLILDGLNGKNQKKEFSQVISNYIKEEIFDPAVNNFKDLEEDFYSLVFNKAYKKSNKTSTEWNNFIKEYAINEVINNYEMLNFFYGTLSEYKSTIDIGKRLKEIVAPGLSQANVVSPTFNLATVQDVEIGADSITDFINQIANNLLNIKQYTKTEFKYDIENIINNTIETKVEEDISRIIKPYLKINSTDAQGYITLDRFENILINEGRRNPEITELIRKAKKGEFIDINTLKEYLNPVKGFYYNRFYDEDLNKFVSKQVKYSTFPLIPAFTKGTQLDELRKHMESNNIDELVYKSTTKVGAREVTKIHDSDGNLIKSELNNIKVETLDNSLWQRQLDVPDDIQNKEKLLAVQIARIIFGNKENNKEFKEYSKINLELLKRSKEKAINDIGFSLDEDNNIEVKDLEKLRTFLIDSIKDQDLSESFLESISPKSITDSRFKFPLFAGSRNQKFQSIFLSKFTNEVTKQKLGGLSLVQFSSTFTNASKSVEEITTNLVKDKDPTEPLKYTFKDNKLEVEILAPPYDNNFLRKGRPIDINELSESVRRLIGYRIPTSGHNYMVTFKVVGFLPREMSSSVIVPKEVVTQMGSDFDVDKLYFFRKHLKSTFKKAQAIKKMKSFYEQAVKEGKVNKGVDINYNNISTILDEVEAGYILSDSDQQLYNLYQYLDDKGEFDSFKSVEEIKYDSEKLLEEQSQKALQNRIVNIFENILTNSDRIAEILNPSEPNNMLEIKKLSESLYEKDESKLNVITYTGQKELRERNLSGQILTGITANFNTFSYLSQKAKLKLREGIDITYNKSDIDLTYIKKNFEIVNENSNEITIKHSNLGFNKSNKFTNVNKDLITDIIGEGLVAAVDTVKEPILPVFNGNKETFPVFNTMIMAGIDHKIAGLFINQPIIKELNREKIPVIRDKYAKLLTQVKDLNYKKYTSLLKQGKFEEAFNYIGVDYTNPIPLKLSTLKQSIKDFIEPSDDTKARYYENQLNILSLYEKYKKNSDEINSLISATKVDNLGAGPTISKNQELIENINKLNKVKSETDPNTSLVTEQDIALITNQEEKNAITKIYKDIFDQEESLYQPVNDYFEQSNGTALKAASELFIQATNYFNTKVMDIISFLGMSPTSKNIDKINNLVISQLISKTESLQSYNYNTLLGFNEEDNSVAKKLYNIQKSEKYKNLVNDNTNILNYLEPDFTEEGHFIKYNNIGDKLLNDLLYSSFKDLYYSDDKILQDLAKDLVRYSFITSGFNFKLSSFSSLIPVDIFSDMGITKVLEDAHRKSLASENIIDEYDEDILIRNNWYDQEIIPRVKKRILETGYKGGLVAVKNNKFTPKRVLDSDYIRYTKYRKATKDELKLNPNKKIVADSDTLYQSIGYINNKKMYAPVPKLGTKNYTDYYNNINDSAKKELYKDLPYNDKNEAYDYVVNDLGLNIKTLLQFNQSKLETQNLDTLEETRNKINILQKSFNSIGISPEIVLDNNLENNAQVEVTEEKKITITLNPDKVFDDTVIHEFGHIYVDMLGYNNPLIQKGINQLKGTQLWKDVEKAYPLLNKEKLEKEVLVTAIGREGANVFKNKSSNNKFKDFLSNLWNSIAKLLGFSDINVAKRLAKEMLNSKLQRNLNKTLRPSINFSKSLRKESLFSFVNKRIEDTKKQINRFTDQQFKEEGKEYIKRLEELELSESLLVIAENLNKRLSGIDKRLTDIEASNDPTPENFYKLFNSFVVLNSFKDVNSLNIRDLKEDNKENETLIEALTTLETAIKPLIEVKAKAIEVSQDLLESKLKPLTTNKEIISGAKELFGIQQDETRTQYFLDALADSNNTFAALLVKDYNTALDKRNLKVQKVTAEFELRFKDFQDKGFKFEDLMSKDKEGNLRPSLITEFDYFEYSKVFDNAVKRTNILKKQMSMHEVDSEPYRRFNKQIKRLWGQFYRENTQLKPNYKEIDKQKKEKYTEEQYRKWKEANYTTTGKPIRELSQPSNKFKNSEFKKLMNPNTQEGRIKRDFYIYFKNLLSDLVQNNSEEFLERGYLPAVPLDVRKQLEAVREDIIRIKKSDFKKSDQDILVNVDESGNVIGALIQPYIKRTLDAKLKEIPEGSSLEDVKKIEEENAKIKELNRTLMKGYNYDMNKVIPEFIKTSYTFNTKKEFESEMLLAKELINHQKVEKLTGYIDKIASQDSNKQKSIIRSGRESNIKQHLDDYINMVFYDDFEDIEAKWLQKLGATLQNFTSITQIGFNPFVGINNKVMATMQNVIESSGGYFFNKKDYKEARKLYNTGLLSYYGGRNKTTSNNKAEAIIKKFNIYQSQTELAGKRGGAIETVLDRYKFLINAAYAMHHAGEHSVQNVTLMAMMNSHRIIDGKAINREDYIESEYNKRGLVLTSEMDKTKSLEIIEKRKEVRKQIIGDFNNNPKLIDIYELDDNGYLSIKEGQKFTGEAFSEFRQKVIAVNQYMHGIYTKEDAGTIQKYTLGRLALQMKKWLRPGWNRRFGTKFGGSFWNERRQAPDEGMYITTMNFIHELYTSFRDDSTNIKINWHRLTEFQKSNIRKTATEMGVVIGSLLIFAAAKGLAEEDDDLKDSTAFNMFIYQTDRLWKEIFTFFPLFGWMNESRKILRSPMASYGLIDDTTSLLKNSLLYPFRDEEERTYQSGVRYGQDKVLSNIVSILPLINKAERLYYIRRNNEFYSLL